MIRISANLPAGISEPAWKNPVNGHDFKNDPERDNHLFDPHKAYHAKDDVKALQTFCISLSNLAGIMASILISRQILRKNALHIEFRS